MNLAEIFPTDEAWQAEKDAARGGVRQGARVQGNAVAVCGPPAAGAGSANRPGQGVQSPGGVRRPQADEDTRNATYQGMKDQVIQMVATYGAEWAFLEPEILGMDPATLDGWIGSTPDSRFTASTCTTCCAAKRTP